MATSDLLRGLAQRWREAGYEAEVTDVKDYVDEATKPAVVAWNPELGKDFCINITAGSVAQQISASDFDRYELLPDFRAVWSPQKAVIETELEAGGQRGLPLHQLGRVAEAYGLIEETTSLTDLQSKLDIPLPTTASGIHITITTASLEFEILRHLLTPSPYMPRNLTGGARAPVLRLEGITADSDKEAAAVLEQLGNSVAFNIDLTTNIPIFPARRRDELWRQRRDADERPQGGAELSAPEYAYDSDPMALYWYGRSAAQLPLLRFLALYQVVEYYYPEYSYQKAQRELRRQLKDPRFDVEDDSDLSELIEVIEKNTAGRGYGSEQEQLHEVVKQCVSPDEMRDFFQEDERTYRFYGKDRSHGMPIVSETIPVDSGGDLRPQVAKRLYGVRCRIVHSKAQDSNRDILLPFSRESALLVYDTRLMQFIARQVLIERSHAVSV